MTFSLLTNPIVYIFIASYFDLEKKQDEPCLDELYRSWCVRLYTLLFIGGALVLQHPVITCFMIGSEWVLVKCCATDRLHMFTSLVYSFLWVCVVLFKIHPVLCLMLLVNNWMVFLIWLLACFVPLVGFGVLACIWIVYGLCMVVSVCTQPTNVYLVMSILLRIPAFIFLIYHVGDPDIFLARASEGFRNGYA